LLLALGAAAGLLLASVGLLESGLGAGADVPEDAVAIVNGEAIRRDVYMRVLAGFESDSRNPLDDADRRHVLDRMIDEELLVQRGLDLGLAQMDRRVRADLTSSLIASVVSTAEESEPSDEALRTFYQEERDFFTRPGRLHVRQIFFRVGDAGGETEARRRALAAREAIVVGGRPVAEVGAELGDEMVAPVPDALLPAMKLREYIGPNALTAVEKLEVGGWTEPVRSGVGVHLLKLVDHTPAVAPPYDEIANQVRIEWRRRTGDRALRAYLDELRAEADLSIRLPTPN